MHGANVCHMHGGKSPQTLQSASRRLLAAVSPKAAEIAQDSYLPTVGQIVQKWRRQQNRANEIQAKIGLVNHFQVTDIEELRKLAIEARNACIELATS